MLKTPVKMNRPIPARTWVNHGTHRQTTRRSLGKSAKTSPGTSTNTTPRTRKSSADRIPYILGSTDRTRLTRLTPTIDTFRKQTHTITCLTSCNTTQHRRFPEFLISRFPTGVLSKTSTSLVQHPGWVNHGISEESTQMTTDLCRSVEWSYH